VKEFLSENGGERKTECTIKLRLKFKRFSHPSISSRKSKTISYLQESVKNFYITYLKSLIIIIIKFLYGFTFQSIFLLKEIRITCESKKRVPVEILGGVHIVYFFHHPVFIFF